MLLCNPAFCVSSSRCLPCLVPLSVHDHRVASFLVLDSRVVFPVNLLAQQTVKSALSVNSWARHVVSESFVCCVLCWHDSHVRLCLMKHVLTTDAS